MNDNATASYADRTVYYVCHPVAPTGSQIVLAGVVWGSVNPQADATMANIRRAFRWLRWLRRSFPESTFIMPWAAAILGGEDDADPAQREAGLVDCEAVAYLVGNVVMVGGRISRGMQREADAATTIADLTWLGAEPPEVVTGETFMQWWCRQPAHPHLHVYADGVCPCGALDGEAGR